MEFFRPVLILLIVVQTGVTGNKPQWVCSAGRSREHPAEQFFTGFGVALYEEHNVGDGLERARERAIGAMVSTVRSNLSLYQQHNAFLRSDASGADVVIQEFREEIVSSGSLEVEDLGWAYHIDQRNRKVYSFVWIDRQSSAERLRKRVDLAMRELQLISDHCQRAIERNDFDQLRMLYPTVLSKTQEVMQHYSLFQVFTREEIFDREEFELLALTQKLELVFWDNPSRDINALTTYIISALENSDILSGRITVLPEVKDLEQSYPFSSELHQLIQNHLSKHRNLDIVRLSANFSGEHRTISDQLLRKGINYLVLFSIHPRETSVGVTVKVQNAKTGEFVVSSGDFLDRTYSESFSAKQIDPFSFEVWTAEGVEVINSPRGFTLFIRTGSQLYVRVIYEFENGLRIIPDPIFKNFYVESRTTETVTRLPGLFSFPDLPFSGKVLVKASLEPFPETRLVRLDFNGITVSAIARDGSGSESGGSSALKRYLQVEDR
ncbi:hypothetical protein CHISP_1906 [Chitinispirillum alkaliphilum]|nr:hypothetical protein CHISP_1906 [Chitinispirillum alkaliphilum]